MLPYMSNLRLQLCKRGRNRLLLALAQDFKGNSVAGGVLLNFTGQAMFGVQFHPVQFQNNIVLLQPGFIG